MMDVHAQLRDLAAMRAARNSYDVEAKRLEELVELLEEAGAADWAKDVRYKLGILRNARSHERIAEPVR